MISQADKMLLRAVPTHFPLHERRVRSESALKLYPSGTEWSTLKNSYYSNDQNFESKIMDFICESLQSPKF